MSFESSHANMYLATQDQAGTGQGMPPPFGMTLTMQFSLDNLTLKRKYNILTLTKIWGLFYPKVWNTAKIL